MLDFGLYFDPMREIIKPYLSQCAQNRYQKDNQFRTSKCSEVSEWQHFPLPIVFKNTVNDTYIKI